NICFFISGISGLIYEVIWTRLLGLVFGNTTFANSTVLTAYMAGLALGSYLSTKYVDRLKNPLKSYAYLEIGIGIYCFLIPFIIKTLGHIYIPIQRAFELSFYPLSLIRFVLCFVVLLFPTTLMGATLPIFSRFYVEQGESFGYGVGKVYSVNTFGAFVGTFLSGFFMIAYLGVSKSINIAVAGNIFAAIVCLLIAYKLYKPVTEIQKAKTVRSKIKQKSVKVVTIQQGKPSKRQQIMLVVLMIALGLSGFSAMVYEVAWARTLVMIIGSSTYAFSIMLATFLIGIAIGSFIFSLINKRKSVNLLWFAVVQLLIGFSAILLLPLFQSMPSYFVDLFAHFVRDYVFFGLRISSYTVFELVRFIVCFLMMILPTILLGSLFPMVTQIVTRDYSELGRKVGTVYSVNTLGNILGSFMAGFILIPTIGIQHSIILAGLLNILAGCGVIIVHQIPKLAYRSVISSASAIMGIITVIAIPSWDEMIMSSGSAAYAPMYAKLNAQERKLNFKGVNEKLLFYKEGTDSTIAVKERESGTIVLTVDGKVDASNTGDMYTQLLLGHLPLLLSKEPKSALVIGLGSGVTLSAVAQYEVEQIDCVEIEPAVISASKFFNKVNKNVLDDPRVNLIVNDGRNFLNFTNRKYDVIISEPSNIWLAGIANLFSQDFYQICKKHLTPNGYICQWSHIYYMSPQDVKTVVNTFRSVFPHATVWFSTIGDILMIGSFNELVIDYLQLAKNYNIQGVNRDMQGLNVREPLAILSSYLLDEVAVAKFTSKARINSDNHPILEFSVPKSLYQDTSLSNWKLISQYKTRDFPQMTNFNEDRVMSRASFWYHLGVAYDFKEMPNEARQYYDKAINVDSVFVPAYIGMAVSLHKEGKTDSAIEYLKKAISIDPQASEAYYNLAQIYQSKGLEEEAIANYQLAIKLSPANKERYSKKLNELLSNK
ncbi:MAG: fused MFS/spermidine synthase, partial [Candidatus Poribacteria bacterium]